MSQSNTLTLTDPKANPLKHQLNLLLSGQFIPEGKTEALQPSAQAAIARKIGVNASVLSNYRSERGYPGDVVKLENRIRDFFKALNDPLSPIKFDDDEQDEREGALFFQTPVVRRVWNTLTDIKRNCHLGAIESVPGLGKSMAVREYLRTKDVLGVYICLSLARHGGHPAGIQQAFMDAPNVESGGFRAKISGRSAWVCDRFRDSQRLIVIDNAETLTHSGLDWVLSFYDDTHCPIALVGNNELHRTISRLERSIGRVYPYTRIDFGREDSARRQEYNRVCAQEFLERRWPEAADDEEALQLALGILGGSGHLRSLQKVVELALHWIAEPPKSYKTPADAIRGALDRHATHRRKG